MNIIKRLKEKLSRKKHESWEKTHHTLVCRNIEEVEALRRAQLAKGSNLTQLECHNTLQTIRDNQFNHNYHARHENRRSKPTRSESNF